MTSPLIPDFIVSLYQNEVNAIVKRILKHVCKKYDLPNEEVLALADNKLQVVPESQEKIRIIRSRPRKLVESNERCIARVKATDGTFSQCKLRFKDAKCKYCTRHQNKPSNFGHIHDNQDDLYEPPTMVRRIKKIY
jgi:Leucine-rich repeat (LRR) protein